MIRIDAMWLASEPLDMRAGIDSALAHVVKVFGDSHPHTAYLFANRRTNRVKVLVHDCIGFWLAVRRLHQGHFVWPAPDFQAQALVLPHEIMLPDASRVVFLGRLVLVRFDGFL